MAQRGRKPGFQMSDEHRVKIANSNILKCLIDHAVGEREMSATQVSAGLGLLKKILPDLSQQENIGEVTHHFVAWLPQQAETVEEWEQRYLPDGAQH